MNFKVQGSIADYEQMLEESVTTIAALRLEIKALWLELEEKSARLPSVEWDAFDDSIEWEFEPDHQCGACGASLCGPWSGKCSMPCL